MFGKQAKGEVLRSSHAPNHAVIADLLKQASRSMSRQISLTWPAADGKSRFILSVSLVPAVVQRDSRGWATMAGQQQKSVSEPEWSFFKETEGVRKELFTMRSTDTGLILTLTAQSVEPNRNEKTLANIPAMKTSQSNPTTTQIGMQAVSEQMPEGLPSALLLSGNLSDVDLPSILQSIGLCKMTGKLKVYGSAHIAEVFFDEGELVHANSSHALLSEEFLEGNEALVDLFTWDDGGFQFQPGWKSEERTVDKRIDKLLLEGAALSDYKESLAKSGLSMDSVLLKTDEARSLTEEQLEKRWKDGLPLHINLQRELFEILSQPLSLQALLEAKALPRSKWIPCLFNLVNLKLVGIAGGAEKDTASREFANVEELIAGAYSKLVEPSGLLKYGQFLLLARSELTRYQSTENPYSVALISFADFDGELSDAALGAIADCFYESAQPIDMLAYKDPKHLMVLLPHCDETTAVVTLEKFLKNLFDLDLPDNLKGKELGMRIGVASVPRDGDDFVKVLSQTSQRVKTATEAEPIVS